MWVTMFLGFAYLIHKGSFSPSLFQRRKMKKESRLIGLWVPTYDFMRERERSSPSKIHIYIYMVCEAHSEFFTAGKTYKTLQIWGLNLTFLFLVSKTRIPTPAKRLKG
ncbi:unnamed protein product [Prunus brigantina]